MTIKAEKLKALIWSYANNSRVIPPTPSTVQLDIQEATGTLYGLDTIARYLCDWYATKAHSIQTAIQEQTGTLHSLDTIARHLCDWYTTRDEQEKNFQRTARLHATIEKAEKAVNSLKRATEELEAIQRDGSPQQQV